MCRSFCLRVCMCTICVQYSWRPELKLAVIQPRSSMGASSALTTEPSLQPCLTTLVGEYPTNGLLGNSTALTDLTHKLFTLVWLFDLASCISYKKSEGFGKTSTKQVWERKTFLSFIESVFPHLRNEHINTDTAELNGLSRKYRMCLVHNLLKNDVHYCMWMLLSYCPQ